MRALDAGVALELVLPNPDLVYPKPGGAFGVTTGAVAMLVEAALHRLRPGAPRFVPLGKPHPPIYAEARRRLGPVARPLAIGDSIETDVAGALAAGIEVALVDGGVSTWRPGDPEPTCRLLDLHLQ
jgi:ribonucleotide monophosphatase NagD (HAD superfamily)